MPNIFTAQFVGFTVEVTCKFCQDRIAIPNDKPKREMDKLIVQFRKEHEKAHRDEL